MTNFKKDIGNIALLIDKSDSQEIFEKSVCWLAGILQKPEKEVNLILKRHTLQDKKKKRKTELDKKRVTVAQLIDKELKDCNNGNQDMSNAGPSTSAVKRQPVILE